MGKRSPLLTAPEDTRQSYGTPIERWGDQVRLGESQTRFLKAQFAIREHAAGLVPDLHWTWGTGGWIGCGFGTGSRMPMS